MELRLRVQTPKGELRTTIPINTLLREFQGTIEGKCGLKPHQQQWLIGFPPKPLVLPNPSHPTYNILTVAGVGVSNGETVIVREPEHSISLPLTEQAAGSKGTSGTSAGSNGSGSAGINGSGSASSNVSGSAGSTGSTGSSTGNTVGLVKHAIADDNACLFNAVGFVLDERKMNVAQELREIVAATVISQPHVYVSGVLEGKSVEEYSTYIQRPNTWGGAVELAILSDYYEAEIAAVDVQTTNLYIYGQGKGYTRRAYLAYNGIHYDCLVGTPGTQLCFEPADKGVESLATAYAHTAHTSGSFTNVRTFTLQCSVCQQGVVGEKGATQHATTTGHTSFQEHKTSGHTQMHPGYGR